MAIRLRNGIAVFKIDQDHCTMVITPQINRRNVVDQVIYQIYFFSETLFFLGLSNFWMVGFGPI